MIGQEARTKRQKHRGFACCIGVFSLDTSLQVPGLNATALVGSRLVQVWWWCLVSWVSAKQNLQNAVAGVAGGRTVTLLLGSSKHRIVMQHHVCDMG